MLADEFEVGDSQLMPQFESQCMDIDSDMTDSVVMDQLNDSVKQEVKQEKFQQNPFKIEITGKKKRGRPANVKTNTKLEENLLGIQQCMMK